MTDRNIDDWLRTTPEAILQAEGILHAFHIGQYSEIGPFLNSLLNDRQAHIDLLVALIVMVDRLVNYGTRLDGHQHLELLRETARVVAEAHYRANGGPTG